LLETQRLAGVVTLAAGVAHELNNPINVITATCNNLLNQIADGDMNEVELKHYIEMIEQSAWRRARLVRAMREYSHMSGHEILMCELNQIIETALTLVTYDFERQDNVIIKVDLEPGMEPLLCDQNQITQVVVNLVTNARDALAPKGGLITISSWSAPEENTQALSVCDNGSGIDEMLLPILCEPFETTKGFGEGSGLGLAISTKIVKEHQGRITVENNDDGGATFTVILPVRS
jgi:two-component system NtrC family sensor kinase